MFQNNNVWENLNNQNESIKKDNLLTNSMTYNQIQQPQPQTNSMTYSQIQQPQPQTNSSLYNYLSNDNNYLNSEKSTLSDFGDAVGSGMSLYNTFGNTGSSGGGGWGGWASIGQGVGNIASSFAQGNDWKPSLQSGFGIDKEDSDTKQSINGALRGAQLGMTFGPIGAGIGALLGLGASFLDDI